MKNKERRNQNYSILKMVLRIVTLGIAIQALVVAYQAKNLGEWVNTKQDNIIEQILIKTK